VLINYRIHVSVSRIDETTALDFKPSISRSMRTIRTSPTIRKSSNASAEKACTLHAAFLSADIIIAAGWTRFLCCDDRLELRKNRC